MDAPAPWFRVPVLFAAPTLLLALVVLAWYARGLLRTEASRVIRALRLSSIQTRRASLSACPFSSRGSRLESA